MKGSDFLYECLWCIMLDSRSEMMSPAADRFRPHSFDDMAGQEHLVGERGILRRIMNAGKLPSMIFFGPPGVGKTTAASIIAENSGMTLRRLNATTASLADVKSIAQETGGLLGMNGILLYLDEIQYFNKKQQQSLLEFIEDGRITLIASTTENPYFYIYDALLSRCTVLQFKPVAARAMLPLMTRVLAGLNDSHGKTISATADTLCRIAELASGDVRRAIGLLESAYFYALGGGDDDITPEAVQSWLPSVSAGNFDRDGDVHYDLLSALQKSIRGSDPDAAVFYLAKLLEGGDLLSPCRRLLVIASEDIGAAYPMAAVITKACVDSARELGLPEGRIPLVNATVMLATAPKSNTAYLALAAASEDIRAGRGVNVPEKLKSPLFKGYVYPHDYMGDYYPTTYLPDDLAGKSYYHFGDNKTENASRAYWEKIKAQKPVKK